MSSDSYNLMFVSIFFFGSLIVIGICLWVLLARKLERNNLRAQGWLELPGNLWRKPYNWKPDDAQNYTQLQAVDWQSKRDAVERKRKLIARGRGVKPTDFIE